MEEEFIVLYFVYINISQQVTSKQRKRIENKVYNDYFIKINKNIKYNVKR